jgi:hypothetical protein
MKTLIKSLAMVVVLASVSFGASGGEVSGVVKDPSGTPFKGAFVRAKKGKITATVLSDTHGRYQLQDLAAGDYRIQATATGFNSAPARDVNITAGGSASSDFTLQKGAVGWKDISIYQASRLLPEATGKDLLFGRCFACHGFQSRMVSATPSDLKLKAGVKYMQVMEHYFLSPTFTDENAADVTAYMVAMFGANSKLPHS